MTNTTPASVTPGPLAGLVQKWRARSTQYAFAGTNHKREATDACADELAALLSAMPESGAVAWDSAEDRFEHYVNSAIAASPAPLQELGEYLTRVLDEDEWKAAERLLLQLAVLAGPQRSMDATLAAYNTWPEDIRRRLSLHDLRRMTGWPPSPASPAADAPGEDDACRRELENIVNARRFDRGAFRDDTEFADWAQSRARHCLARPSHPGPSVSGVEPT